MKRVLMILAVGLTLSVTACNSNSNASNKTVTAKTTETEGQQIATETTENMATESSEDEGYQAFAAIMDEIYGIRAGSAGTYLRAEEVVDDFKAYMEKYGMDSASMVYETLADQWFDQMLEQEGEDVRTDFSECLDEFISVAYEKDSDLEYDVYFSNIVSGMQYAIEEE